MHVFVIINISQCILYIYVNGSEVYLGVGTQSDYLGGVPRHKKKKKNTCLRGDIVKLHIVGRASFPTIPAD
jgi:hypothetical protein